MVAGRLMLVRCLQAHAAKNARRAIAVVGRVHAQPVTMMNVRSCSSSSRFLSLADDEDDGTKKRRRRDEDGEVVDDEDAEELLATEDEENAEEQDGAVEFDEDIIDINQGGVDLCEETDNEIMELHMQDPVKWTTEKLARKFHYSKPRIEAIIYFKGLEAGLELDELKAKIALATEDALKRHEEEAKKLAEAEASGDVTATKHFQKRKQQEERDEAEIAAEDIDEMELFGLQDDVYRNPDFFFLKDEFEGYPPLVRRLGKHAATDKLYPEEAIALQKFATNNKVEKLKSFAKPTEVKGRWKIAVKDISKHKKPLYVHDESKDLRLATDQEVLPRTWVRRPPFFAGLDN